METKKDLTKMLLEKWGKEFADRVVSMLKTDENKERMKAYLIANPTVIRSSVLEYAKYEKESVEVPR